VENIEMENFGVDQVGFENDYIHFVIVIPPKYLISQVIGKFKA
jgi:REP element-mobilizing transposase RayT